MPLQPTGRMKAMRPFTYHSEGGVEGSPFVLPEEVELREDVPFVTALEKEWLSDLFLPRAGRAAIHGVPAVIYVHGGSGNRQQFWHHAARLAAAGIAGVCIQHPFRRIDVPQAAVRWVRRHAAELGIDPQRIGAAGSSAGSYLACLLGILDAPEDGISSKVSAVLSQKGLYGSGTAADTKYFGDLLETLSPYRHARADTAPTLLIHAEDDSATPYEGAVAYHRRLRELGVWCELITDPAATHGIADKTVYYDRVIPECERFFGEWLVQR